MKHRAARVHHAKSSPVKVAAGSGSRPNGGKFKIPTSAPRDMRTLGRHGSLR